MTSTDRSVHGLDSRDRGIGFQAIGFATVGILSAAALYGFDGSEHWTFKAFELCATKLYWAFVVPLAAIFDGARKMFETRGEIRREIGRRFFHDGIQEGIQEGRDEERRDIRARMERAGLPLDVIDSILPDAGGDQSANGAIDPQIKRYIDERFDEMNRN